MSDPITPLDSIVDREMAEIELDQRRIALLPMMLGVVIFAAFLVWGLV